MTVKTTRLVVSDDVESERDKSIGYATAMVVVDSSADGEPITVATTISAVDSPSKCERSVISIEPSVLQLVTVGEEIDPNERKAQLCCGCCCDLVRACIIVDIIYMCYSVLIILGSWWGLSLDERLSFTDNDDDGPNDYEPYYLIIVIIQLSTGLLFASLGIIGASKFRYCLVLACAIWFCIDLIISSVNMIWPSALMKGFFAYPHFALFMALKSGKITRGNYMVERHCCCDAKDYKD